MKKSLIFRNLLGLIVVSSIGLLSSCVKNRNTGAPDFTQISPIVQIVNDAGGAGTRAGLDGFSNAALLFDGGDVSDTAYFRVNYAATNPAGSDVTITLGFDAAALAAYNAAYPNPANPYTKFPDSIYKFTQTSVVVKAGQNYSDLIKLTVYPNKVDPSKNFMFPISITATSSGTISGNFGTIYYHFIGNPLAGPYQDFGVRWSMTGSVPWAGPAAGLGLATAPGVPCVLPPAPYACGAPTFTFNRVDVFAPVDGQTVAGTMGNVPDPSGGSAVWLVTGNASFSAISLDVASTFRAGYSNIDLYTRAYVPPSATQKPAFRLVIKYNNTTGGAGNDRLVDQSFTHL